MALIADQQNALTCLASTSLHTRTRIAFFFLSLNVKTALFGEEFDILSIFSLLFRMRAFDHKRSTTRRPQWGCRERDARPTTAHDPVLGVPGAKEGF